MVTVASITHTMTCTPSKRHTHKHTSQLVHIHLHPLNTVIQIHPNTRHTHKWNEIQQVSQWLLGGSHGSTVPPYRHPSWANSGLGWGCKDHNHHFGMPNRHLWMAVAFLFPFGTTPVMNTMESPHSLWTTSSEWYGLSSFLWTTPALKEQQSSLSLWTTPMSLTSYSRGPATTEKAKWWITLPDKGAAIRMLAVILVSDFCCWFLK